MDLSRFAGTSAGRLVRTLNGAYAFVPHDLPPPLDAAAVLTPLVEATAALGELNGIVKTLPDPFLLISPLQAREALTSSSMEGTYTTVDALLLAGAGFDPGQTGNTDTREVLNYQRALRNATASLSALPLSLRTLRNAHADLLSGVRRHRGAMVRPGEWKDSQNWIGGLTIDKARFVPPPPAEAATCMDRLERYWHRETRERTPPLIDAALVHCQFETIHPFADGNGRVGRMLIPLMLYERGAIRQPLLYVSPYLEQHKDMYIDRMFEVSTSGDWSGWIVFFLESVTATCRETIATADKLFVMREGYRDIMQQAGRSALLLRLVDFLFVNPVFSIPQLQEHLGVTYRAARSNLDIALQAGIAEPVPGTSHPQYFVARDIVRLIDTG